jgi:hypothetical protein
MLFYFKLNILFISVGIPFNGLIEYFIKKHISLGFD